MSWVFRLFISCWVCSFSVIFIFLVILGIDMFFCKSVIIWVSWCFVFFLFWFVVGGVFIGGFWVVTFSFGISEELSVFFFLLNIFFIGVLLLLFVFDWGLFLDGSVLLFDKDRRMFLIFVFLAMDCVLVEVIFFLELFFCEIDGFFFFFEFFLYVFFDFCIIFYGSFGF